MAKILYRSKAEAILLGHLHEVEIGYCGECGAKVGRNQYGRDDDCPECDAILDWDAEEGE